MTYVVQVEASLVVINLTVLFLSRTKYKAVICMLLKFGGKVEKFNFIILRIMNSSPTYLFTLCKARDGIKVSFNDKEQEQNLTPSISYFVLLLLILSHMLSISGWKYISTLIIFNPHTDRNEIYVYPCIICK